MSIFKWMIGWLAAILSACAMIGCNSSGGSSGGGSLDDLAKSSEAQKATLKQQEADAAARKAEDDKKAADAAAAAAAAEKKAVGSRPQMEGGGYFRAAASARRHAMNVADQIAWIQGVRSFKAEEGRKPKNNEEFMKVVVPKYDLQLPKLEPDEEYLYDPNGETDGDFGQLYVVKKGAAGSAAQPGATAPTPPAPPTPGSVPTGGSPAAK